MTKDMSPDFREGLIAGYDTIQGVIEMQLGDPAATSDGRAALSHLLDTVKLDLREIERGEGEKP